jgi:hypothetical protein
LFRLSLKDTDKVIYVFKVGWRFGLFFDLNPRTQAPGSAASIPVEKFDLERMELDLGALRRYLSFYHVYKTLESTATFKELKRDGWFPFVEMLDNDYQKLAQAYSSRFAVEDRVKAVVEGYTSERLDQIISRWWTNPVFAAKKELIEAGVGAYKQNTREGDINTIKNLLSEIEGILRSIYRAGTGKSDRVKQEHFVTHIIEKAKKDSGSDYSLLLPEYFLDYLQDVVFANFNSDSGEITLFTAQHYARRCRSASIQEGARAPVHTYFGSDLFLRREDELGDAGRRRRPLRTRATQCAVSTIAAPQTSQHRRAVCP